MRVERRNLQALVTQVLRYPTSRHFLFEFREGSDPRAFLHEWAGRITHGAQDLANTAEAMSLALTWQGLVAMRAFDGFGGNQTAEAAFPLDFQRLPDPNQLGDVGNSDPSLWWHQEFETGRVHLTVHLYSSAAEGLAAASAKLRASAVRHGLEELKPAAGGTEAITGESLGGRELHFGFHDGFSQPEVDWDGNRPELMHPSHFVLGAWSEEIQSFPRHPPMSDFVRDGSYLAFRWIYQDVARFNRYLRENATRLAPQLASAEAQELLAAKMMGRWRDGTPLVVSPDQPDARARDDDANRFTYAGDLDGRRCPFSAHIRIVNPRDQRFNALNAPEFEGRPPRVLRRGMAYGPKLEGEVDDGVDRGVIGLFVCSDIRRQFYTLTRWMRQTDFSPVFADHRTQDPLFANRDWPQASRRYELEGKTGPARLEDLPTFVRTRGTLLLFLPSLERIRELGRSG